MRSRTLRAVLCLLIVLSVPVTLAACAFGLPPQYDETFLGGLSLKWDALERTETPRVVVVGGSGVAFALRCDLLEEELSEYRAVNFGLYAGLGTTVMLDLALPMLREGDVVIFAPELSEQTLSTYFRAEAMWQAADGRPELLAGLGRAYRGPLAAAFPGFAGSKLRLALDGSKPAGNGVYARSSFNGYGDIDAPGRERNTMSGGYDSGMPIFFDPALPSAAFYAKVNDFTSVCRERGVRVFFGFCPMNAAAIPEEETERMDAFRAALDETLDCELLGDPAGAVMDPGWFFDTNFHLNRAGAVVYTARLAAALKAALGDGSPVAIDLPEMPLPEDAAPAEGYNGDETCFLYETGADGVRVVGLSQLGRTRERLTLPVSREGQPVTAFDAAVFAGNDHLREVVIQSNIRRIDDGSFAGCAALSRIAVQNPVPSSCAVGAGLLDGTDALLFVPADRVSAYCTDYFWSIHAGRIRADEAAVRLPAEETPAPTTTPSPERRSAGDILYEGNGGALIHLEGDSVLRAADRAHRRVNTLQGTAYFRREGCVLLGWNTAPDGSGQAVGLGSRTERMENAVLYAQWAEASPASDFVYEVEDGEVRLRGYTGSGVRCVIPETIDGLPVRRIFAGAFADAAFTELVLPSSLRVVEPGAFTGCAMEELWLFDSLREIGDDSFERCAALRTLHINAAVSPVYSGSYYDTFSDKYDWLLSLRDQRKLVLFSGSSGRYGYDSPAIRRAFPGWEVANMGVYAYANALPQLELIRALMTEGDILLSAPEFDAIPEQFCASNRLDRHFWAMMESNYDAASHLDLRNYDGVFDSFGEYLLIRSGMAGRSYGESPASYDDEGNYYAFPTYNEYGDFILPRPNGDRDERQHKNVASYTAASFPPEYLDRMNEVYESFLEKGVTVYFSYTPRSRSSLTEASTPEARRELAAYLETGLCVPVISDMEDYLLSGIYFWQIDSHLSTEGAVLRTARVIEDLRAVLPP